jgi:protein ImuA
MAARTEVLEELRRRVRRLEGIAGEGGRVLPLGPALDAALPEGGLPLGCLHEIGAGASAGDDPWGGAATGFAAALAGRVAAEHGPVLWLPSPARRRHGPAPGALDPGSFEGAEPYGPGLAAWGLAPERLLVVRAATGAELLWALEEALRCRGLGAALAEVEEIDPTSARRLQLAAEAGGVTAFLLRPGSPPSGHRRAPAAAAVTRWAVTPVPGRAEGSRPGLGAPLWRLDLLRCRGGRPGAWIAEWRGDALHAAPLPPDEASGPAALPARSA